MADERRRCLHRQCSVYHPYATALQNLGRFREAIVVIDHALEIAAVGDPYVPIMMLSKAETLEKMGACDERLWWMCTCMRLGVVVVVVVDGVLQVNSSCA